MRGILFIVTILFLVNSSPIYGQLGANSTFFEDARWTAQMGDIGPAATSASGVATDSSGNVFVAGQTSGGLDGNTLTGNYDFFVTKCNSSGVKQWTKQLGVASKDTSASGVATDSSGNVFVGGYTSGGLDGNTLTGSKDFFLSQVVE